MTTNRTLRLIAILLQAALPVVFGAVIWGAHWTSIEVRPVHSIKGTPAQIKNYNENIAPVKPHNKWETKDLIEAGFPDCVKVQPSAKLKAFPVSHVVRLPAAEGYDWVMMGKDEVAKRNAIFGGTKDISDDVKIAGNCF